jgi:hypothetical protein
MRHILASLLALSLLAVAPPVRAQDAERPWAKGVTQAEQDAAIVLFKEGNTLLRQSLFPAAAAKYRESLTHWDHPAIHYNLALALLNLEQPIEVYHHFEAAVKYGTAPIDQEKVDHAKHYMGFIEGSLPRVEITCDLPGAVVTLDGTPLFTGPGKWAGMVRAEPHSIVATKPGYMASQMSQSLMPGKVTKIKLRPMTNVEATHYKRKWDTWKPWVVVGGGAAVVVIGGVLHMLAGSSYDDYDKAIEQCSLDNGGHCQPTSDMTSKRDTGDTLQTLGFVGYGLGGAAIVTGAVLLYLNRSVSYQVEAQPEISVAPMLTPGGGGVMATVRF